MNVTVAAGSEADLPIIRKLLVDAGLPEAGLMDVPTDLLVARDGEEVLGAVAVEHHGPDVLIRSMVVGETRRGEGVGSALLASAEETSAGSTRYLLTETAADFFSGHGYERIERDSVPAGIAASAEWAWVCAETAVAMRKG